MTNPGSLPNPQQYVRSVLTLYLELPETPLQASARDHQYACQLQQRGVPLTVVEAAFLLASLRRLARPADCPPLSPIHSLAYFQPVIEELLYNPVAEDYLEYLRHKLTHFAVDKIDASKQHPAKVQKTPDSDDR